MSVSFRINSTLYKNAGFSLDKSYAIFPQILYFSEFFPSPWYFFPAILSAVVFFRNTTAGGKISCLKIDRDKNSSILHSDALGNYLQVMITIYSVEL